MPTDHVPQCYISLLLEQLQGWWLQHLPLGSLCHCPTALSEKRPSLIPILNGSNLNFLTLQMSSLLWFIYFLKNFVRQKWEHLCRWNLHLRNCTLLCITKHLKTIRLHIYIWQQSMTRLSVPLTMRKKRIKSVQLRYLGIPHSLTQITFTWKLSKPNARRK